jgi:hypothetical protein
MPSWLVPKNYQCCGSAFVFADLDLGKNLNADPDTSPDP